MDEETLIKRLRQDSGLPPPAPGNEWQALQVRLRQAPAPERRSWRGMAWVGAGLALAGAALVLWPPLHLSAPQQEEDGAQVLAQLMALERQQMRPQVAGPGARWLALMDEVKD